MMVTHTKKLFVFLFVGLVVLVTQGAEFYSIQTSLVTTANITQATGSEQETSGEVIVTNKDRAKEPNLPEDTSPRLTVKEISINGNNLISTEDIFKKMPLVYNASNLPLLKAQSEYLYDLSDVHEFLSDPNSPREISTRTIDGLVQYILSLYQKKHYAGIRVYVPKGIIRENRELIDGILLVNVLEATVSDVTINFYTTDQNEVEKSYLRLSAIEEWSPVEAGEVMNSKSLDDFVNLLNLNPDRYISAVVSEGSEPNTLALGYNIYETDPWHYFVQVDNSGTNDRQWAPRAGFINTNLLGFDDRFTTVYHAKPDSTIDDNYSIYGSYDIPVLGPKLRLNVYAGHSEFNIDPEGGPFNFLGRGTFYGASLKYNLLQQKGWFLDLTTSYSNERSKVTPSLFPSAGSDVDMDLLGFGAELRRSDDISNTSFAVNNTHSIGGSNRSRFNNARTNADPDFNIYTFSANHNRYLDQEKYKQLRSVVRWIWSDERLVPAKMTSFGGMYSVRGYDEYEIVADGGILASIQYEFDWLKYQAATEPEAAEDSEQENQESSDWELRKLSPLVFFDYGRAHIKDALTTEKDNQYLYSVGTGMAFEVGKNLSGAAYYGYPLRATDDTRRGKGRLSVSFMMRW